MAFIPAIRARREEQLRRSVRAEPARRVVAEAAKRVVVSRPVPIDLVKPAHLEGLKVKQQSKAVRIVVRQEKKLEKKTLIRKKIERVPSFNGSYARVKRVAVSQRVQAGPTASRYGKRLAISSTPEGLKRKITVFEQIFLS
ncbi:hypothetical protein ES703_121334 [subsurface metagenome]